MKKEWGDGDFDKRGYFGLLIPMAIMIIISLVADMLGAEDISYWAAAIGFLYFVAFVVIWNILCS